MVEINETNIPAGRGYKEVLKVCDWHNTRIIGAKWLPHIKNASTVSCRAAVEK